MARINIQFIIFTLTLLSLITLASATLISPANSDVIAGTTIVLNATNSTTGSFQPHNCTFYAKSALTANSSWSILGTFKNGTDWNINGTFNSNVLEDANDYTINASCVNATNLYRVEFLSTASITVDNTLPTAPTLSPVDATAITAPQTQTFTGTIVDKEVTSCNYTIYKGSAVSGVDATTYKVGTGTYSGTTCTFTNDFTSSGQGTWYWFVTASDETNSTSATTITYINNIGGGGGSGSFGGGGGAAASSASTASSPGISQTAFTGGEQPTQVGSTSNIINKIKEVYNNIINFFKNLF